LFSFNDPEIVVEILISMDKVKKNASLYGKSFKNEFIRVIIHGCLHLTGQDDATQKQKELIRAKENFYLSKFWRRMLICYTKNCWKLLFYCWAKKQTVIRC
jgi:rRNA maturation RNase YbeY